MEVHFSKYSGCGNDFILIDDREERFPCREAHLIKRLCHRNFGIGADGVVLLQRSSRAAFRMRIFNADGSEAEMCGNGVRCLMQFILELGFPKHHSYSIETMHSILNAAFESDHPKIDMGAISTHYRSHTIDWKNSTLTIHSINTGVPHAIMFVEDISRPDFIPLAAYLRNHPYYGPSGTNVSIAKIDHDQITLRTYERGVENETQACGTGAAAAAILATELHNFSSPVTINFRSQEKLHVHLQRKDVNFSHLTMTGPASLIFKGHFQI